MSFKILPLRENVGAESPPGETIVNGHRRQLLPGPGTVNTGGPRHSEKKHPFSKDSAKNGNLSPYMARTDF